MQAPPTLRLTKLRPPHARSALPRGDLQRLVLERTKRFALVVAPAGFGKTTLLANAYSEIEARGEKVGWISIDTGDNDIVTFVSHLVHVLGVALPEFGTSTGALLGSGLQAPTGALTTALLNDLLTGDPSFHLFLDDFHLITDAEIEELIKQLLYAPLPAFRVSIASRTRQGLPLARLRVLGELEEIVADDLKFSPQEARAFFAGTAVSDEDLAILHTRTEGWVAGLQLASIALRTRQLSTATLREFSGDREEVAAFLAAEVYRLQVPEIREFLEDSAILDRFCSALCNAVTGHANGAQLLETVQGANLFIFSLDAQGEWFRYHHLFSVFLRGQLHRRDPERERELHRRASRWFMQHDHLQEAIEHAFAGADVAAAARLLDQASHELFARGLTTWLNRYADQLPVEVRATLPRLQLVRAWDQMLSWDFDAAEASLRTVREHVAVMRDTGVATDGRRELEFLNCVFDHRTFTLSFTRDQPIETLHGATAWLAKVAVEDAFLRASAGTSVMYGQREQYDFDASGTNAQELRDLFVRGGALYGTVFHDTIVGATFCAMGELEQAAAVLERARDMAMSLHGEHSPLAAMPSSLLAEIHYEKGELHSAETLLREYQDVADKLGFVDNLLAHYVTRAKLEFALGRNDEAERVIAAGESFARRRGFMRLAATLATERIRQLLQDGKLPEAVEVYGALAEEWPAAILVLPKRGVQSANEIVVIAHARIARARNTAREAIPTVSAWLRFTRRRRAYRSMIRLAIQLALLKMRAGDAPAAFRDLKDALSWAQGRGFVTVFLDEGADMAAMLDAFIDKVLAESAPTIYRFAVQLRAAFDREKGGSALDHAQAVAEEPGNIPENMTEREREILELSAQGYVNREVAATLLLSEATVKWYWRRILQKMGLTKKSQAVRVAQRWATRRAT